MAEYAEMVQPVEPGRPAAEANKSKIARYTEMAARPVAGEQQVAQASDDPRAADTADASEAAEAEARQQAFAELLAEFRQTPVLVPLGTEPGPGGERGLLTADFGGLRFLLAFSDERALARYAQARDAYRQEWTYQRVLGAKLLDIAVPAAGVPCGVALDCADGPDGMVFPPVVGVVPDEVAVDRDEYRRDEYEGNMA
ncbi:hypothetical protein [Streptomyces sp. NPDC054863]